MSWLYPAPCTATATAVDGPCGGRCTCACLPHAECGEALPESVRAAIAIECDMRRRLSAFKADSTNGFELGALDRLRVLGEGGFSKVRLCTSPSHEGAFALKMLHKGKIEQLKQVTSTPPVISLSSPELA